MAVYLLNRGAQCGGPLSKAAYDYAAKRGWQQLSLGEAAHLRRGQPTVLAVGGNSLDGYEDATVRNIVYFLNPVVTHGNGPQVGKLMIKYDGDRSLNECVGETQVDIGQNLKGRLKAAAARMGRIGLICGEEGVKIDVVPTRVIVDANDPAFEQPTKYIGKEYNLSEVQAMGGKEEKEGLYYVSSEGWWVKEFKGKPGVYRRVVASPKPLEIHPDDLASIRQKVRPGYITIACGGGGRPYSIQEDGSLKPEEAVIDKDLASAVLAGELRAREFIISTAVRRVALNFGTPKQYDIDYIVLQEALKYLLEGQFPPGSMGEKMEAAINALRFGVNSVLITHPELRWLSFEGTLLTRGPDLEGRVHNLTRMVGNIAQMATNDRYGLPMNNELERWLVANKQKGSALESFFARLRG